MFPQYGCSRREFLAACVRAGSDLHTLRVHKEIVTALAVIGHAGLGNASLVTGFTSTRVQETRHVNHSAITCGGARSRCKIEKVLQTTHFNNLNPRATPFWNISINVYFRILMDHLFYTKDRSELS